MGLDLSRKTEAQGCANSGLCLGSRRAPQLQTWGALALPGKPHLWLWETQRSFPGEGEDRLPKWHWMALPCLIQTVCACLCVCTGACARCLVHQTMWQDWLPDYGLCGPRGARLLHPSRGTHTSDEQRVAGDPLHRLQQEAGKGHSFTSRVRGQLLQIMERLMRKSELQREQRKHQPCSWIWLPFWFQISFRNSGFKMIYIRLIAGVCPFIWWTQRMLFSSLFLSYMDLAA